MIINIYAKCRQRQKRLYSPWPDPVGFRFSTPLAMSKTFSSPAKFISRGIPVVMGEWASTNKNNLSERVRHAEYYVRKAKAVKIPTIWWDNNNPTANTNDAMGLLNRSNNTWYYPSILTAIMNGNK